MSAVNVLARKLLALSRTVGARRRLAAAARCAFGTVYAQRTEVVVLTPLRPGSAACHPDEALHVEAITPGHASCVKAFNARHRTRSATVAVAAYLHHGYGGFAAFLQGELVGYCWWVSNGVDRALTPPCLERLQLALNDDEVFAFGYFVTPASRDRGVDASFSCSVYDGLARLGYRSVWGVVDADRAPGRWVHEVHGGKLVKRSVSHQLLSRFLLHDRGLFLRNSRWHRRHPFAYRLLVSLGPSPAHGCAMIRASAPIHPGLHALPDPLLEHHRGR